MTEACVLYKRGSKIKQKRKIVQQEVQYLQIDAMEKLAK